MRTGLGDGRAGGSGGAGRAAAARRDRRGRGRRRDRPRPRRCRDDRAASCLRAAPSGRLPTPPAGARVRVAAGPARSHSGAIARRPHRPLRPAAGRGRLPPLPAAELRGAATGRRRRAPDHRGSPHHCVHRDRRSPPLAGLGRGDVLALPPRPRLGANRAAAPAAPRSKRRARCACCARTTRPWCRSRPCPAVTNTTSRRTRSRPGGGRSRAATRAGRAEPRLPYWRPSCPREGAGR
jgi:hypothetical protein